MKRKISAALLAALLLFQLAACGSGAGDTAEKGELQPVTLCLDWTPNTNHTGFFAAQALGYYAEEGLEVTIQQPPEDGAVALCASGRAQFSVDAQDTLAAALASEEPLEVTAVAALVQHNTSGILSRAGEGIHHPGGLTDHTYSTWDSPIELAMLETLVNADGGDWSRVHRIYNNITDEPAALTARQTDAIWVFEGWSAVQARLRGMDYDFFRFSDLEPVFDYYTPVLIANNAFLAEQPEVARAFLRATAKGYAYAVSDPGAAASLLIAGDSTGSLNGSEDLVLESQKFLSAEYEKGAERWGWIDPERWNAFYRWLTEKGLVEVPLADGTGFSNDYLPA